MTRPLPTPNPLPARRQSPRSSRPILKISSATRSSALFLRPLPAEWNRIRQAIEQKMRLEESNEIAGLAIAVGSTLLDGINSRSTIRRVATELPPIADLLQHAMLVAPERVHEVEALLQDMIAYAESN